ncbi:MAG: MazG family protein, partial [Candidatus Delongbacteria bacterium]|nr:MazG family protein [Candidatus Delongbacteria bacterium]
GMVEELGDFLFSLVNVSRYLNLGPEDALRATVNKFIRRFTYIEERLAKTDRTPATATLAEMDALWDEAKLQQPE